MIQSSRLALGKDFVVKSEIPVDEFNAYFEDMGKECRALHPVVYSAVLVNNGQFITLEADMEGELEFDCDLCGETFSRKLGQHVSLRLVEASHVSGHDEIELSADDLDCVTFIAPDIDLHAILLESVYLELDDSCLCREDCRGICSNCGQNLNRGSCSCSF